MKTPATSHRVARSLALRSEAANHDAFIPAPPQIDNGDEALYSDKSGTYTKGVLQDAVGVVDPAAWLTFRAALDSGNSADFENIVTGGGPETLNGPQGGLAFLSECADSSQFAVPPAPAVASELYATELIELYWAALLRDVAFTGFAGNTTAMAAASELTGLPAYQGPRDMAGNVTTDLLFRGGLPGETIGPYLSQFILLNTNMGALNVVQQYQTFAPGMDYMKNDADFLAAQNGQTTAKNTTAPAVFMHNGRGLGAYTHQDVLYQAYFTALLVLSSQGTPRNPGNPYVMSDTQNGFATMGGPDFAATLTTVANEALKAVWYQKWFVHLRHRPESGGAIVELIKSGRGATVQASVSNTVLNSNAVAQSHAANHTWYLPQAFPEGSPLHPAYPTGHGTVAGACITVLKFFFQNDWKFPGPMMPAPDGSKLLPYTGPHAGALTVAGELNKLAHNISFGHGIHAGIHWRSDTDTSIQLGEAVALSFLRNRVRTYNEPVTVTLTKIDGTPTVITNQ